MIGIVYDRELRETGTGLSTKKPDDSLEDHQVNLEIYIVTKLKGLGINSPHTTSGIKGALGTIIGELVAGSGMIKLSKPNTCLTKDSVIRSSGEP